MEISAVTAAVKSSQISINMIETLLCYFICLLIQFSITPFFYCHTWEQNDADFLQLRVLQMSVFQRQTGLNPWNGTHGKGPILSWKNVINFNFNKLLQSWCSGNPQTGQKLHWDHLDTSEMFLRTNWSSCLREKNLFVPMTRKRNIIMSKFSTRKLKAQCFKAKVGLQYDHGYRRGRIICWCLWGAIREMFSLFWHEKIQKEFLKQQEAPQTSGRIQTQAHQTDTNFCQCTQEPLTLHRFPPPIWLKKGLSCSEEWHSMGC